MAPHKKLIYKPKQTSPKTPTIDSPVRSTILSNCSSSTPLSSRYNNMFEESQSRENEIYSPTLSQDIRQFGTDVTWQWNTCESPKRHLEYRKIQKVENTKLFLKTRHSGYKRKQNKEKDEKITTEVTGFFKFQEELLSLEKNSFLNETNQDTPMNRITQPQLEILKTPENKKSNIFNNSMGILQKNEILNNRNNSFSKTYVGSIKKTTNSSSPLLDDSDLDLLKCSEDVEETILRNTQINTITNNKKNDCTANINDSVDEFLSDIPLDEVISQYYTTKSLQQQYTPQINIIKENENVVNKVDSSSGYCSNRFSRCNSMPDAQKVINNEIKECVKERSFLRHVSMPLSEQLKPDRISSSTSSLSQISNTSSGSFDSLISASSSSSYKICSAEEIEEKRRQAIERLRSNKFFNKNMSKLPINSIKNSNSNTNNYNRIDNKKKYLTFKN